MVMVSVCISTNDSNNNPNGNSTNNTATDITNIVAAGAVDREFWCI